MGSALIKQFGGEYNLFAPTRTELDLLNRRSVWWFFKEVRPDYVFLAAAKVGNISDNIKYPADFLEQNLLIQHNIMRAACESGVKKLLFFGSNCCYPRECPQPMKEDYLLDGKPEPTNQSYAIAKLAGIEMCCSFNRQYGTDYIVAIPASIYGENDHFNPSGSHVLAGLMVKFHKAKIENEKSVTLWGDGSPRREYIYSGDVAEASIFLMDNFKSDSKDGLDGLVVNVGTGFDLTILEISEIIKKVVGYDGKILWDASKPNGMPRKLLDSSKCHSLGWRPKTEFEEGLRKVYSWYVQNRS